MNKVFYESKNIFEIDLKMFFIEEHIEKNRCDDKLLEL